MSKLLIDDKPVMVLPRLACAVGLNEAIVLQQVHYWLETYSTAGSDSHFRDGLWWVYNTKAEWQENFPWWSDNTVWRALVKLRDLGLLRTTSAYNQKGYDRTLWYTIDYDALTNLEKSILPKWVNALSQNGKMDLPKMVSPIPETTPEITTETTTALPQPATAIKPAPSQPTTGADAPAHSQSAPSEPAQKRESAKDIPAAVAYHELTHRWPPRATWAALREVQALSLWQQVVTEYIAHGWNPGNISGMLEFYHRHEIPGTARRNGNGAQKKSIADLFDELVAETRQQAIIDMEVMA